jgi:hypothetical protein
MNVRVSKDSNGLQVVRMSLPSPEMGSDVRVPSTTPHCALTTMHAQQIVARAKRQYS